MAWSSIATATGGGTGGSTTTAATLSGAVSAGQTICVCVTWDSAAGTIQHSTLADQLGNTYSPQGGVAVLSTGSAGQAMQPFVCIVTVAGTPVITATHRDVGETATSATDRMIIAQAFSGSDAASAVEDVDRRAVVAPGTGTDATATATLTVGGDGRLLWTACFDSTTGADSMAQGTGFTTGVTGTTPFQFEAGYKTVDTGTPSGTWTASVGGDTFLVAAVAVLPAGAGQNPRTYYFTEFLRTENPISEGGGQWVNGQSDGVDWGDFRTNGDRAWGTRAQDFRDNTSIMAGTWPNDQYAQAKVFKYTPDNTWFPEVELRLRSTIASGVNQGYEIGWSLRGGASSYLIIVRWNGAAGSFDYLVNETSSTHEVLHNDIVYADIIGNNIRAYVNGVLKKTVDITSIGGTVWSSGAPGFGQNANTGGSAFLDQYGFQWFRCGQIGAIAGNRGTPDYTTFSKHPQRLRYLGIR